MFSVGLKSAVRKAERESIRDPEGQYNMSLVTCGTTTTQVQSPKTTPALTAHERCDTDADVKEAQAQAITLWTMAKLCNILQTSVRSLNIAPSEGAVVQLHSS